MRVLVVRIVTVFSFLVTSAWWEARAANLAADDAADAAYSGGWTNGSNGGYGFGAWNLSGGGAFFGHFLFTSTANGNGLDDGAIGGVPSDFDIDTSSPFSTLSWGMFASFGSQALAQRDFTGGALAIGQTFSIDFDNGFIEPGGRVGVALTLSGAPIFQVLFTGGSGTYDYSDSSGINPLPIPFGDEGLNLTFNLTGTATYQATLTRRDGLAHTWTGTLAGDPDGFGAFNFNAGGNAGGPPYDFFINSASVVPEPSTLALLGIGLAGLLYRRRAK